jgi:glycosyltransferase involved in cell wall biosynthesis
LWTPAPTLPAGSEYTVKEGRMTRQTPLFSVVIPVHNRAEYLPAAVASALGQDYNGFEVLVVDDGSIDGGPERLATMGDPRLRIERLPHGGAPRARNSGIDLARGRFVVWLDSDDVLEPGTLAAYAKALDAYPDAEVMYGRLHVTGKDLQPVRTIEFEDWRGRNRELLSTLVFRCPLPHPGTAVAKACYQRVGGYDETFKRAHDYEFWTRLALKAVFAYVPRPVCRWRWHDANMSTGSVSVDTRFEARIVEKLLQSHPLERLLLEPANGDGVKALLRLASRLHDLALPAMAADILVRAGRMEGAS